MSNENHTDLNGDSSFVLKHRIAGAAFLLFFGSLFLPWLLGPPSEASKTPQRDFQSQESPTISSSAIEEELLAEDKVDFSEVEEQVYISRITPLDSNKSQDDVTPSSDSADQPPAEPAKPVERVSSSDSGERDQKLQETPSESDSQKDVEAAPEKEKSKPAELASKPSTEKPKVDNSAEQELQAALAAESSAKPKIDIGWAVQVGVFENKKGAQRVVKDLTAKGFKPSVTIVDTNRGKGTGTRVWLGPFAQRVEAAKAKSKLTQQTGEAGFIRAYP